jgi:hypothetical protein
MRKDTYSDLQWFPNNKSFQQKYEAWKKTLEVRGARIEIIRETTTAKSVVVHFRLVHKPVGAKRPLPREPE